MKKTFASLVLALLFLTAMIPAVGAQTPVGAITGVVANGTPGGTAPGAVQITVYPFQGSTALPTKQVESDADGHFRIDGLETGADYGYFVTTEYLGVQYATDLITFAEGETTVDTTLYIYETTTSDEGVSLSRVHFVVAYVDGSLDVTEVHVFSNSGDRTYIGADPVDGNPRTTVRFVLPDGVADATFPDSVPDERVVKTDGGFADVVPVTPGDGTLQMTFSYLLPYDPAGTNLTTTLQYAAGGVNVFVPDIGIDVASDTLASMGTMGSGDQAVVAYVGQGFAAGDRLSMTFSGEPTATAAPATTAAQPSNGGYLMVGGGLALLLLAAAIAYPLLRRKQPEPVPVAPTANVEEERDELMMAIADLDDAFEAGEMAEDVYRNRRQALKARLIELERLS